MLIIKDFKRNVIHFYAYEKVYQLKNIVLDDLLIKLFTELKNKGIQLSAVLISSIFLSLLYSQIRSLKNTQQIEKPFNTPNKVINTEKDQV